MTGRRFGSPVLPGAGWPEDPATAATPVATTDAQVRQLAQAATTPAELDARVSVCRACPRLVAWRELASTQKKRAHQEEPYWGRPVPSLGDADPRVLVVGLAPAAHGGNRTGRMFTGDRSGDWIHAALHRAGYAARPTSVTAGDGQQLTGARLVAPVHCAPPENRPTPAERATCGHWLDRELQLARHVESILALGGIAWQSVHASAARLGWRVPRPRVGFTHGAQTVLTRPSASEVSGVSDVTEVRLVGCYHVSQQNTFTGRLTEAMLDEVIARL